MLSKRGREAPGENADAETLFRHLVEQLQQDEIAVVDHVLAAFRDQLPTLTQGDDELSTEVTHTVRQTLNASLATLNRGSTTHSLAPRFREIGRRRAMQGVPLAESLLGYELGAAVVLDECYRRLPAGTTGTHALAVAHTQILDFVRTATSAVTNGYQESAEVLAADRDTRLQRYLEVLVGSRRRTDRLAQRPQGISDQLSWALATPIGTDPSELRWLRTNRSEWPSGWAEDRVIAFTDRRPTATEIPLKIIGLAVIHGEPADAWRQAAAAADVAQHLGMHVAEADTVGALGTVLSATPTLEGSRLNNLLTDQRHRSLLETLETYLRHGMSVSAAARALHVHRHTLQYRLDRIRELTNLDLTNPVERLTTEILLFTHRNYPASPTT